MLTFSDELAAVRRTIHRLRVDQARPTYRGWAFEHRHGTEQALARAEQREAALVQQLADDDARTLALTTAATASGWPLLYAIAHVTAGIRPALTAQEPAMAYTLALADLLDMSACDAIGGDYYMPDDPEMPDFRASAVLDDKRKDPWYPALVEDIRINGLRVPIWIHNGEINDGLHRIAAAQDLGLHQLPCTDEAPDDPESSARVYDFATKTWTYRGWTQSVTRPA